MEEFLKLNGIAIAAPSSCSYQLIDLSSEQSGRSTLDGTEHKDIVAQKRKLVCRWNAIPARDAAVLAQNMKMRGAKINVTYFDIAEFNYVTKIFTTGDFQCDYLAGWTKTRKFVGNITCNFVEA